MLKQYFKQAWHLIKQNKLFSGIYIAGTALGISMVMVMAIINHVKTANIYPETNRDRTLYVKSIIVTPKDTALQWTNSGGFSYKSSTLFFLSLKTPELVSLAMDPVSKFVSLPNDNYLNKVQVRYVDNHYWNVFHFHFLSGKSFTEADFRSGIPAAVISESLAKKLYGTIDIVGKYIECGFKEFRIAGVVKDVSYVLSGTYAQVWIPYTTNKNYNKEDNELDGLIGSMRNIYLLAHSADDFDMIRTEVNENIRRYNAQSTEWNIDLAGQPDTKKVEVNRFWSNVGPDMHKITLHNVLLVLLFLLVPAINLSGLNSTRMEQRMSEMGVRKAFGASRKKLFNQIFTENLLLTFGGGLTGLLLSYLFISVSRNWILDLGKQIADILPEGATVDFSLSMLFNLKIFVAVLLVCFVMNLLSALIPVYRSLRKNITDSLHIRYT
ncbi:ABC transporter permease [Proteiniphilum sp.]|uniref:ABC transporter permease n=1 Tax=Proteiniphilum sp. TaxID=1926877 RepID=UPI0033178A19